MLICGPGSGPADTKILGVGASDDGAKMAGIVPTGVRKTFVFLL
jgi:hypothetical protein